MQDQQGSETARLDAHHAASSTNLRQLWRLTQDDAHEGGGEVEDDEPHLVANRLKNGLAVLIQALQQAACSV